MNSIGMLIGLLVIGLLLSATVLTIGARCLKSPRRSFGSSLLMVLILAGIGFAFMAANSQVKMTPSKSLPFVLGLFLMEIVIGFLVLKWFFKISAGRTFVLYSVYFVSGLLAAGLAIVLFRPYVAEAFVLPTGSMVPTINAGDRFLANKLEHPRRWDIVVYKVPGVSGPVCKRLVGLPGETLKFEQGNVFVNGSEIPAPPVVAGRYHMPRQSRYHDGDSITLANDEFFTIGDHVELSYDSRFTGPAKSSSFIGVVDVLYWPLDRVTIFR